MLLFNRFHDKSLLVSFQKRKTKIQSFVEILRLVENKATTKIRYARSICNFFVHSSMGSIPFSSAVVILINNAGYSHDFHCWFGEWWVFMTPGYWTILYSDCSLSRNIALHNVMLHCCFIITGLKSVRWLANKAFWVFHDWPYKTPVCETIEFFFSTPKKAVCPN